MTSTIFFAFVILFVIIVFVGVYVYNKKNSKEIEFASAMYMTSIIKNSQFFHRMTQSDLYARNIGTTDGYIKLYNDNIRQFTNQQKSHLTHLTQEVNTSTAKSFPIMNKIQWKFAKVDVSIEKGWPHTLGDVIILSNKFFEEIDYKKQLEILLHEKIHVFQRLMPIETNNLIDAWGFSVVDKIENYPMARNNPDINNFVYCKVMKGGKKAIIQLYNSATPNGIDDSSTYMIEMQNKASKQQLTNATINILDIPSVTTQYEHPYEIMGTFIPKIILYKYDDDTSFTQATKKWLSHLS